MVRKQAKMLIGLAVSISLFIGFIHGVYAAPREPYLRGGYSSEAFSDCENRHHTSRCVLPEDNCPPKP